jgi:RimJ/RimL family protein N-acetyltransferase
MHDAAAQASSPATARDARRATPPPAAEPVQLRLLDERDRELYHALHASLDVMRAIGPTLTPGEIDARFGRVVRHNGSRRPGHRAWAIAAGRPPCALGLITLLRNGMRAELGVMLLPHAWHRGVATRGIRSVLPLAFGELGLDHVDASRPDDAHARRIDRLLLPLGFRPAAGLRTGEAGWTLARPR